MQFDVVEIRWAGFLHGIASSYATNQTKLVWDKRRQGKQRQYMYLSISHHGLRCHVPIKTEIRSLKFFVTRFSMKWNNLNQRIRTLLMTIALYSSQSIYWALWLARLTFGCCYSAYCSGRISYRLDVLPVARPIVSKQWSGKYWRDRRTDGTELLKQYRALHALHAAARQTIFSDLIVSPKCQWKCDEW